METLKAPEYLRRERVFGEYEHERMVYNERGELVSLTQLLEGFHHEKMLELIREAKRKILSHAVNRKTHLSG